MTGFELTRVATDGTPHVIARDTHSDASGGRVLPFHRLIERYISSVRSGAACMPSFEQGLRAQYLLSRIETAAETATKVACDEDIFSA
jgi:predicted dehydrogenase